MEARMAWKWATPDGTRPSLQTIMNVPMRFSMQKALKWKIFRQEQKNLILVTSVINKILRGKLLAAH